MESFAYRFIFLAIALAFLGVGCSVDHTGLLPVINGNKYHIDCVFDTAYRTASGDRGGSRFNSEASYCFNGAAPDRAAWNICREWATVHEFGMRSSNPEQRDLRVTLAEAGQRLLRGEECSVLSDTPSGVGMRTDMLISPGTVLVRDESGQTLGDTNVANTQAAVSRAIFRVSAKFAAWRHAVTSGTGQAVLDAKTCSRGERCPLILRYFELELDDFTIVRPTGFAKDVTVRNAKLYSISNYETTVDRRGHFSFNNVKAVVSAVINGEKVSFISEIPTVVTGRFGAYRGGFGVAPQRLLLNINETTPRFKIRGAITMNINKFEANLMNRSTSKCLRGTLNDRQISRASIGNCRGNGRPKSWLFEKLGNTYQIRQPFANACLNLKTNVDNREGGPVYLVGCSNHRDQRWSIGSNGSIRHIATGKCLNVHRGRENRNGGLVTVYSCANTPDQRWLLSTAR